MVIKLGWFMANLLMMISFTQLAAANRLLPASDTHNAKLAGGVQALVTSSDLDSIFPNRNAFYSFDAFVKASKMFPAFCGTGSTAEQKRELAAFLAHAVQETGSFGFIEEIEKDVYCDESTGISCASGQMYYGRGPLQLTWNFNYAAAGEVLGLDLLNHPGILAEDAVASFAASIWFWMTADGNRHSCHEAILGNFKPTSQDESKGLRPGLGFTLNVVNGAIVCGNGESKAAQDKIDAYVALCERFGVDPGPNLDCERMDPL